MENSSKRFARDFSDDNDAKRDARPHDYRNDPKFNKGAAVKQEMDFYAKMDKVKTIDAVLEKGAQAREIRKK